MTTFIDQLEADLLDAADRLRRQQPHASPAAGRWRRRNTIVAVLVTLVVATPALAGVPGLWSGWFVGPGGAPTVTSRAPNAQLLALLGALRRAPGPQDQSLQAREAVSLAGALTDVSSGWVRYVGTSPIGSPIFMVPYASRVRVLPPLPPSQAKKFGYGNLRRFLDRPGVCLVAVSDSSPDLSDCESGPEIEQGTANYGTVGVYRTAPTANPIPIGQAIADAHGNLALMPHVVATEGSEILPDGVAAVELIFASHQHLTLQVTNNYIAFLEHPGETEVLTAIWRNAAGATIKTFTTR